MNSHEGNGLACYELYSAISKSFSLSYSEETGLSPPVNILLTVPRRSLCASVYMCFGVTCWERADLLALVCGVLL